MKTRDKYEPIKFEDNQKKIDLAIISERELYADLANALPSGIYRLRIYQEKPSLENNCFCTANIYYKLDFFNDRFCEILNLDRSTIEKNPGVIYDFLFEQDKAEFVRLNVEANINRSPFIWEGRLKIKDNIIWIHFESIPRVLENTDIIWTGTLIDVSDRKKTEQEIQLKNLELEKVNAEKDKFLSIIAHDLKSPFNSIIGFSELLVERVIEKDYEKIGLFAKIITQSSNRAMDLLMNLMVWAQSQSGRMVFNPEDFEMVTLINEVTLLLSSNADQKSIVIHNPKTQDIHVNADKAMISTVLRNLVSNAIKFTHTGGSIAISAIDNQNELIVSVSDNGVGIPNDRLNKLFHLNNSYSTPGTKNEKGTGLGLIICKELVEKNNGHFWVESTIGSGSTFFFSLPLNI